MAGMTKLEAVNLMLDAIGEDPVNSLSSGNPDAEDAERRLGSVTKDVLDVGWHYNTRIRELVADNSGYITVPGNALSVDTVDKDAHLDVVVVNSRLYDLDEETDVWTVGRKVKCQIIYSFDFADLPYALQRYIAARAAREFQESVMGSVSLDSFTARQEQMALENLNGHQAEKDDFNMVTDNGLLGAALYRNNRFWGRR